MAPPPSGGRRGGLITMLSLTPSLLIEKFLYFFIFTPLYLIIVAFCRLSCFSWCEWCLWCILTKLKDNREAGGGGKGPLPSTHCPVPTSLPALVYKLTSRRDKGRRRSTPGSCSLLKALKNGKILAEYWRSLNPTQLLRKLQARRPRHHLAGKAATKRKPAALTRSSYRRLLCLRSAMLWLVMQKSQPAKILLQ